MRHIIFFFLFAGAAAAQPVINAGGVVNIASVAPLGLPNTGLAQGSIFVVNGTGLGAPNGTPMNLFQSTTYPLPTSQGLNGTTIQLIPEGGQGFATANQGTVSAIMLYESPTMLAAIVPSSTVIATYTITVTYNGQASAPTSFLKIVQSAFGLFQYGQLGGGAAAGFGPGLEQQLNASGSYVLNNLENSATPGETILLYGTGLGAVSGDDSQGPAQSGVIGLTTANFQVYIGGQAVPFVVATDYAGRFVSGSVSYAGIDLIAVEVPKNVQGCYVAVTVVAEGVVSNTITISVDPGGAYCSETYTGYSLSDLQQIHNDQAARVGTVSVAGGTVQAVEADGSIFTGRNDNVTAGFVSLTAQQLFSSAGSLPSPGGCVVVPVAPTSPALAPAYVGTPIDAGPALNLNGPDGYQQILQMAGQLTYAGLSSTTNPLIDAGGYSLDNGGGGGDVGPFQGSFNVPGAPQGITGAGQNIPTGSNLTIGWSAADPNSVVLISGFSVDQNTGLSALFACTAPPAATSFTVPSYVLSWLPTTDASIGYLAVQTAGQARFQAPGLEVGYFTYEIGPSAVVQYTSGSTGVKEFRGGIPLGTNGLPRWLMRGARK